MKFSFGFRIIAVTSILAGLIIAVGLLAYFTTQNLQKVSRAILKENVASLKAAEELELALLNQKGYVASYFLDGDEQWLSILEDKKGEFDVWYEIAREVALTQGEQQILKDIPGLYQIYDNQRNRAINLFQDGQIKEAIKILMNDMKKSINDLYQRCEDLILENEMLIARLEQASGRNVARMTLITWMMIAITLLFGSLAGFISARRINKQLLRHAQLSSLGQLAANIAHEIRNPITSIKMRLYTLQQELKHNSGATEDLNVIYEDIDSMEKTVKNFLDFTRLPEPKFEETDIKEILDATVLLLLPKAQAANVKINKEYAHATCPALKIDREQMRRAFVNIMLNAIEAMPQGGPLTISVLSEKSGWLKIIFKDTGKGIPVEQRSKVFEPFFTTKEEGTGLGLFITSRIIQAHKGLISLSSQPAEGTSVAISLPLDIK